jgi:hypothetical protein
MAHGHGRKVDPRAILNLATGQPRPELETAIAASVGISTRHARRYVAALAWGRYVELRPVAGSRSTSVHVTALGRKTLGRAGRFWTDSRASGLFTIFEEYAAFLREGSNVESSGGRGQPWLATFHDQPIQRAMHQAWIDAGAEFVARGSMPVLMGQAKTAWDAGWIAFAATALCVATRG